MTNLTRWYRQLDSSITEPLWLFVITRLALVVLVYIGLIVLPENPAFHPWHLFPENLWLDGWFRWDSGWYIDIARYGYTNLANLDGQRDTAFFPLFPLLAGWLGRLIGSIPIAGLLISVASSLTATILFFQLVTKKYGQDLATRSITLWLLWPFSFYLTTMYTEPLFVLLAVGAFYLAERRQWAYAALLAGLASGTRSIGVLVGVGLLLLYLEQKQYRWSAIKVDILWLLLAPLGLVAYIYFLAQRFGEPLAFVASQQAANWAGSWDLKPDATVAAVVAGGANSGPLALLLSGQIPVISGIHAFIFVAAIGLVIWQWRKLTTPYAVWTILTLLVSATLQKYGPVFSGTLPRLHCSGDGDRKKGEAVSSCINGLHPSISPF